MPDRVFTLDALCAALFDALRATNATLAHASSRDAGPPAPAHSHCIGHPAEDGLHTGLYIATPSGRGYQLSELSFSLPCCVATRRVGLEWETVLMLHTPAWWKRLGRPVVCRQVHIRVHEHALVLRFDALDSTAVPSGGNRWTLRLSHDQRDALAASIARKAESASGAPRTSLRRRIASWLGLKRTWNT